MMIVSVCMPTPPPKSIVVPVNSPRINLYPCAPSDTRPKLGAVRLWALQRVIACEFADDCHETAHEALHDGERAVNFVVARQGLGRRVCQFLLQRGPPLFEPVEIGLVGGALIGCHMA